MAKAVCSAPETRYKARQESFDAAGRLTDKDKKGAFRMTLWVRALRELTVAGVVLAGGLLGVAAVSVVASTVAVAQTVSSIVVEGNRRVESDTIRSYFRPGPGGRRRSARSRARSAG